MTDAPRRFQNTSTKNAGQISAMAILAAAIGAGFTLAWTDSPQNGATSGPAATSTSPATTTSAPTSQGTGLKANFFGTVMLADDVVYVIDRSGSMLDTFDALKNEVTQSISLLDAKQNFSVIFFAKDKPIEIKSELQSACDENKRNAKDFIKNVGAEGCTNAITAIEKALKVLSASKNPNRVIYFLTDAGFDDPKGVLAAIKAGNKSKIVINTYIYGSSPNEDAEKTMHQIASDSNGKYKWVEAE